MLLEYIRSYQFHKTPLLCDDQELACTPKDPPRQVDMNEMSLTSCYRKINELSTNPFETQLLANRLKTAYALLYLDKMNYMNRMRAWGTQAWEAGGTTGGDWEDHPERLA